MASPCSVDWRLVPSVVARAGSLLVGGLLRRNFGVANIFHRADILRGLFLFVG